MGHGELSIVRIGCSEIRKLRQSNSIASVGWGISIKYWMNDLIREAVIKLRQWKVKVKLNNKKVFRTDAYI